MPRNSSGSNSPAEPLDAIGAVNELIAIPWADLARQYTTEAEQDIQGSLEGKDLAKDGNHGGEVRWSFSLTAKDVRANVDVANPPGLSALSPSGFGMAAPLDGNWSAKLNGKLEGHLRVWMPSAPPGTPDILSWGPTLDWGIEVRELRLSAGGTLNASDPDWPIAQSFSFQPHLNVGGSGAIPISVPLADFEVDVSPGMVKLSRRITNLGMDLEGLGAHLTANLEIVLQSMRPPMVELERSAAALQPPKVQVRISLNGQLSFGIPRVGAISTGFGFGTSYVIPSVGMLEQIMWLTGQQWPRTWGVDSQGHPLPLGMTPPPPGGIDYATPAGQIDTATTAHMPYGAVFSIQSAGAPRLPQPPQPGLVHSGAIRPPVILSSKFYAVEEDSAIWTGHYLAAEAFRYAATSSPDALERVRESLAGIHRLFDVTTDAAVKNGHRVAVQARGIFARSALPTDSAIGWWEADKSIENGRCYYEWPEGGWDVVLGDRTSHFGTYAEVELFLKKEPPLSRLHAVVQPVGRVWRGLGCGGECDTKKDHPVSRDQYAGVAMGLFAAHQLVADDQVHATARDLITQMLSYLLDNNWNVPLPPGGHLCTSYLGNFDHQLALLRIGKTVNPEAFGAVYDRFAAASAALWLPLWLSLLDPIIDYYKFNLAHALLWPALLAEDLSAWRDNYMAGYRMLRRATAHHRNAYFNLARILVEPPATRAQVAASPSGSNPDLPLRDEIQSTLAEWLTRFEEVKTENGLPSDRVPEPHYQVGLWPNNIQLYIAADQSSAYLAKFALPVNGRIGDGMDFMWQRDPFGVGLDAQRPPSVPPTDAEIEEHGGSPNREGPAVDYLLAYWMAVYLGVLPSA